MVLGKGTADELDDATIIAEAKYFIKVYLSLHYNGSNRFLYANSAEINQFKAKD